MRHGKVHTMSLHSTFYIKEVDDMKLKEFLEKYKEELKGFEMTSVSSKNEIILMNDPYVASIEMKIFCQKVMPLHNILKINPTVR